MKIIANTKSGKIMNLESLPRGTGARYLEVMESHIPGELIAVRWRRTPKEDAGHSLIDMEPNKTPKLADLPYCLISLMGDIQREITWEDIQFYAETGLDLITEGEEYSNAFPRAKPVLLNWKDKAIEAQIKTRKEA